MGRGSKTIAASAPTRADKSRQPFKYCGPTGISLDPDTPLYSHLLSAYWQSSLGAAEQVIQAQAQSLFASMQAQGRDPMDSFNAATAWQQLLADQGYQTRLQYGEFIGHRSSYEQAQARCGAANDPEHCWLLVDGKIFDPTATKYCPLNKLFKPDHYLAFDSAEETVGLS